MFHKERIPAGSREEKNALISAPLKNKLDLNFRSNKFWVKKVIGPKNYFCVKIFF